MTDGLAGLAGLPAAFALRIVTHAPDATPSTRAARRAPRASRVQGRPLIPAQERGQPGGRRARSLSQLSKLHLKTARTHQLCLAFQEIYA